VGVAPGRLSQGPDDIKSPHGERPCNGDGLRACAGRLDLRA
jgi:hypothetical protein